MEASLINSCHNFLDKKESNEQLSKSSNLNQEKKPDFNNNDYPIEEIQEIKPVIQHNIQRKRPVFTVPPSKKRSISQGKPFNIIHKYYDENFILEDDEEEGFKKYIRYNEDSRSDSKDNSRVSLNSKNSLFNSNKKSLKKFDDIDEDKKIDLDIKFENNCYINENIDCDDGKIEENNHKENNNKEIEKSLFKRITEEFYNEIEPF